jgi:hypothetical protein
MNQRMVVMPVLAVVVAVGIWLGTSRGPGEPPPADIPACTWRVGAADGVRHARSFDELPGDTPVRLSYVCSEPRHVYVFGYSQTDGTVLLFPSPDLKGCLANPLPPGRTVLPGTYEGKDVAWTTRVQVTGATTLVAVASATPIAEFEALLPRLRRWTNSVFPDRRTGVTNPPPDVELIGKPLTPPPDALLQSLVDRVATEQPNGPMLPVPGRPGVFAATWKFVEKPAPEAKTKPSPQGVPAGETSKTK